MRDLALLRVVCVLGPLSWLCAFPTTSDGRPGHGKDNYSSTTIKANTHERESQPRTRQAITRVQASTHERPTTRKNTAIARAPETAYESPFSPLFHPTNTNQNKTVVVSLLLLQFLLCCFFWPYMNYYCLSFTSSTACRRCTHCNSI